MRTWIRTVALAAIMIAAAFAFASPAPAQATRTWVSGVGDDANPCTRTAPCKTFLGAISKTAAGGEINCLDAGGYGSVTITKSLAIICDAVTAGSLAPQGTTGIIVNAGASDEVLLSGLDIFGAGTGSKGVRFIAGGSLHVRNSIVHGFGMSGGVGISYEAKSDATLLVTNSQVSNNEFGILSQGSAGQVIVSDSVIFGNQTGIASEGTSGLISTGDNVLAANVKDGNFTGTMNPQ